MSEWVLLQSKTLFAIGDIQSTFDVGQVILRQIRKAAKYSKMYYCFPFFRGTLLMWQVLAGRRGCS